MEADIQARIWNLKKQDGLSFITKLQNKPSHQYAAVWSSCRLYKKNQTLSHSLVWLSICWWLWVCLCYSLLLLFKSQPLALSHIKHSETHASLGYTVCAASGVHPADKDLGSMGNYRLWFSAAHPVGSVFLFKEQFQLKIPPLKHYVFISRWCMPSLCRDIACMSTRIRE